MGLSESQMRAQIERLVEFNLDERCAGWSERTRRKFYRELDVAKGLAFRSRLPHQKQQRRYRESVLKIIEAYCGEVRYDPQTTLEMQEEYAEAARRQEERSEREQAKRQREQAQNAAREARTERLEGFGWRVGEALRKPWKR